MVLTKRRIIGVRMSDAVLAGAVGASAVLVTKAVDWWMAGRKDQKADEHVEHVTFVGSLQKELEALRDRQDKLEGELEAQKQRYWVIYAENEHLKRENLELKERVAVLEAKVDEYEKPKRAGGK